MWNMKLLNSAKLERCQGCILSLYILNLYTECIVTSHGSEETDIGIKVLGEI